MTEVLRAIARRSVRLKRMASIGLIPTISAMEGKEVDVRMEIS
jgi:hypothetical protein